MIDHQNKVSPYWRSCTWFVPPVLCVYLCVPVCVPVCLCWGCLGVSVGLSDEHRKHSRPLTDYVALTCTNIWMLITLEVKFFSSHLNLHKYSVEDLSVSTVTWACSSAGGLGGTRGR